MLNTLFAVSLITPTSSIIDLNDLAIYVLDSSSGLGMAPFHRLSERSSQQHGETDLGFRLDPRVFKLHLSLRAATPTQYYSYRSALLQLFRPSNTPFTLAFTLPNGSNPSLVRYITCYLNKGLVFDTAQRKALVQEADIELLAPDPTFFDPTQRTATLTLTPELPLQDLSISYAGNWSSYPKIEITGPLEDPLITNTSTNEKLSLTYHLAAGEVVTIDTAYGVKTVKNGAGTNLIGKLTSDSDLATFHIDHELVGSNVLQCSGVVPAGQHAHVTVKYYDRFIGI